MNRSRGPLNSWRLVAVTRREILTLAIALLAGCTGSESGGDASATVASPAVQSVPVPIASTSPLARVPTVVSDAFLKERTDVTVLRVRHRLFPDGMVHYAISFDDGKGVRHEDEYRSDGVKLSSN